MAVKWISKCNSVAVSFARFLWVLCLRVDRKVCRKQRTILSILIYFTQLSLGGREATVSNPSRKHLTKEQREVIEAGLLNNDSARTIAKRLGVSPSTITREVKTNRTLREKKSNKPTKLSHRCVHVSECDKVGSACSSCFSLFTLCKQCRTKQCIYYCSDFMRKVCPQTQKWPYICPANCKKRSGCNYQKASYSAYEADQNYRNRLSSTRSGIAVTQEETRSDG